MALSNFFIYLKQKLTTSQKSSLFFVLLLILILPLSLAAMYLPTQLKNRAYWPITSPITPPIGNNCLAINRVIKVTPKDGPGNCHDLQEAIDAVDGDGFKIIIAGGYYQLKVAKYYLDQEYNIPLFHGSATSEFDFRQSGVIS